MCIIDHLTLHNDYFSISNLYCKMINNYHESSTLLYHVLLLEYQTDCGSYGVFFKQFWFGSGSKTQKPLFTAQKTTFNRNTICENPVGLQSVRPLWVYSHLPVLHAVACPVVTADPTVSSHAWCSARWSSQQSSTWHSAPLARPWSRPGAIRWAWAEPKIPLECLLPELSEAVRLDPHFC